MPLGSVKLLPGINVERTQTLLGETGYTSGNLIRFRDGLLQKLGGWLKYHATSVGSTIRHLHSWQDLNAVSHLGIGAESSLQVLTSGTLIDATPLTETNNVAVQFSTNTTTALVSIRDADIYPSPYFAVEVRTQV